MRAIKLPDFNRERLLKHISVPEKPRKPAMADIRVIWTAVKQLLIYLLVPVFMLLICMIGLGVEKAADMPKALTSVVNVLGYLMALGYLAKRTIKKDEIPFSEVTNLKFQGLNPSLCVLLAIGGFCMGLAVSSIIGLLPISEIVISEYESGAMDTFQGSGAFMGVFIVGIFCPITEEIFFRGFLMNTLKRSMTGLVALAATAVVFGLLHGQIVWICYAVFMGLLLGWAAQRFESLLASILVHFGFNLSGILITAMPAGSALGSVTTNVFFLIFCTIAGLMATIFIADRTMTVYDDNK